MRCPSIVHALTPSLLSLTLLAGRAGAASAGSGDRADALISAAEQAATSLPDVTVHDSGTWDTVTDCGYRGPSYLCFHVGRFWVDLSVANLARDKTVGIVWTDDGWVTQHSSLARYEGSLDFGRERWGVEVTFHGGHTPSYGRTVQYAAFVTQSGDTSWDPLNDHVINRGELDLADPVQVRDTSFTCDPARGGAVMSGRVRVVNLARDKQVTLRVTSDGWRTSRDVEATWQTGNDFAFTVADLGVPEQVAYAVRYRVAGVELWGNDRGRNVVHDLAPRFTEGTGGGLGSGAEDLSGNYQAVVWASGALPVESITCLLDGAPLPRCDTSTWSTGGSASGHLSTSSLADGYHRLSFTAAVCGGHQTTHSIPFTVHNRVTVEGPWQPQREASPPAPVSIARDAGNRIFVLYADGSVTRHDAFGEASTRVVPDEPRSITAQRRQITVDDQGRILVLSAGEGRPVVHRYLGDGNVDTSFGGAGQAPLGSGELCVDHIGLAGDRVYGVDRCQGEIVGLDAGGKAIPTTRLNGSVDVGLCGDGKSLWVVGDTEIEQLQPGPSGLVEVGSTPVQRPTYSPALACTGGALTVHSEGRIFAVDASGTFTELWTTGGFDAPDLPGNLDHGSPIARLDDGSVLGLHGGKIDRLIPVP